MGWWDGLMRWVRREPEPIQVTVAKARRSAEALNRPVAHNKVVAEPDWKWMGGGFGTY